jgi:hypothetical protein
MLVLGAWLLISLIMVACGQAEASPEVAEEKWLASAHADEASRAFSRWNDDDPAEIPTNCAKCHSTTGYHDFLGLDGSTPGQVNHPAPVGTTVECEACHNEVSGEKTSVVIPSGAELTDLGQEANCMECHQGRTSTASVDEATAGLEDDVVDSELSFINVHNKAAAPTQYGTLAKGGFEYDGQEYVGFYEHVAEFDTCIECHDAHLLEVYGEKCSACHIGALTKEDRQKIRVTNIDYDGDGDISEGLADEINTMRERLLASMKIYAARTEGVANISYEDQNPYFFDEDGEGYSTWTPRLLRAAYNYHYTTKEPGGYAHNGHYHIQLIYDSLQDLGFEIPNMTRPETD